MYLEMPYSEIRNELKRTLILLISTVEEEEAKQAQTLQLPFEFTNPFKKIKSVQDLTDIAIIQKTLLTNLAKIQGIDTGSNANLKKYINMVIGELQEILADIPELSILTAKKQEEEKKIQREEEKKTPSSSAGLESMLVEMKEQQLRQHEETQKTMSAMAGKIDTLEGTLDVLTKNSEVMVSFVRYIEQNYRDVFQEAVLKLDGPKQQRLLAITADDTTSISVPTSSAGIFGKKSDKPDNKKISHLSDNPINPAYILKNFLQPYLKGIKNDPEHGFVPSIGGLGKESYAIRAKLVDNLLTSIPSKGAAFAVHAQLYVSFLLVYKYSHSILSIKSIVDQFLQDKGIALSEDINQLFKHKDVIGDDIHCIAIESKVLDKANDISRKDLVLRMKGSLTFAETLQFSLLYAYAINGNLFNDRTASVTTLLLSEMTTYLSKLEKLAWYSKVISKARLDSDLDDLSGMLESLKEQNEIIQTEHKQHKENFRGSDIASPLFCDARKLNIHIANLNKVIPKASPLILTDSVKESLENAIAQIKNYFLIMADRLTNQTTILNSWYEINQPMLASTATSSTSSISQRSL